MGRSPTKMSCPRCGKVTRCNTIYDYDPGTKGDKLLHLIEFEDLEFRSRWRKCEKCENEFETVEIVMEKLEELAKWRKFFHMLKQDSEMLTVDASLSLHLEAISALVKTIEETNYT